MKRFGYDIVEKVISELTKIRKAQKLSHEKVALKSGLHRTTIGLVEAGKRQPTLLTLLKIASALECDLGKIIAEAEKATKTP